MSEIQRRQRLKTPLEETSIYNLPEAVLLHIISFIPFNDTVRISGVGRRWRNLWRSVPSLYFDMISFQSKLPDESWPEARRRFADFINNTLNRRPSDLAVHKFKLLFCYGYNGHTRNHIDSWFRSVISANAVELDLYFSMSNFPLPFHSIVGEEEDAVFHLSSSLFLDLINSSVEVLKFHGFYFEVPKEALHLKLVSVRQIHLERFFTSREEIANLIASCVNLESLSLALPQCIDNLKIVSQKLKHLKLCDFNNMEFSVEICAPRLLSLSMTRVYAEKFTLEKSPSLIEAEVVFDSMISGSDFMHWTDIVSCLGGVERLATQNMWSIDLSSHWYPFQPGHENYSKNCVFHNLKHLELLTGFWRDDIRGLKNMFEQCPQLETLVLVYKHGDYYNRIEVDDIPDFRIPYLRLVKMKEFRGSKDEMYVVKLLKKHGVVLEKIVAYPIAAFAVNGNSVMPPFVL